MKMSKKLLALAALGLSAVTAPAYSAIIQWDVGGRVDARTGGQYPSFLNVGDTFSFSFRVDSESGTTGFLGNTQYSLVGTPTFTLYDTNGAGASTFQTFSLGSAGGDDFLSLLDTSAGGAFNAHAQTSTTFADVSLLGFANMLSGEGAQTLPNLSRALTNVVTFGIFEPSLSQVFGLGGHVTSFSASPVPLPAAAWLLLSGLAGVGVFARRRRRPEGAETASSAA